MGCRGFGQRRKLAGRRCRQASEVGSFLGGGLQKVEMRFGLLGLCPVLGHVELKLGSFRPGMLNHNFSGPDASNW